MSDAKPHDSCTSSSQRIRVDELHQDAMPRLVYWSRDWEFMLVEDLRKVRIC